MPRTKTWIVKYRIKGLKPKKLETAVTAVSAEEAEAKVLVAVKALGFTARIRKVDQDKIANALAA